MTVLKDMIEKTIQLAQVLEFDYLHRYVTNGRDKGFSDDEIAAILDISVEEVEYYAQGDLNYPA